MKPDLSVLLAVHREATLLRRTLLSLGAAVSHATAAGHLIELIVTLDRSDAPTRAVLAGSIPPDLVATLVLEVDEGCPGPARNAAIAASNGRLLATADADDLIAPDFLTRTIAAASNHPPRTLLIPQWLLAFGSDQHVVEYLSLAHVGARACFGSHPFVHRICGHRSELADRRYVATRSGSGVGFEDWHFSAEAIADGFDIQPVEGAILFYRRKEDSRLAAENARGVQLPPCRLFDPDVYASLPAAPRLPVFDGAAMRARLMAAPGLDAVLRAANAIEPDINPDLAQRARILDSRGLLHPRLDDVYGQIAEVIGTRRFAEVFLLPFISTGGADRYIEDLMLAMYAHDPTRSALVVFGHPLGEGSDITRVPPNAAVIDLAGDYPDLSPRDRDLVTLRLIQAAAPGARIHMRPSPYTEQFMAAHAAALSAHEMVYYRFGEPATLVGGIAYDHPFGFDFIARHLPRLTAIVADNTGVIEADRRRLGLWPERWHLLVSRMAPAASEATVATGLATTKRRLLWASRPDAEKRPELLRPLAEALAVAAPALHIDAYGNSVFGQFDTATLAGLPNLTFHGPHAGFETLDHAAYDSFIYTSWFDGLPIVLLEAAAHGLPIIAPDVGGVGDFVIEGQTGILLPSLADPAAMVEAYVKAILDLQRDAAKRIRLAEGALRQLRARHSPEAHSSSVSRIFGHEKQQ